MKYPKKAVIEGIHVNIDDWEISVGEDTYTAFLTLKKPKATEDEEIYLELEYEDYRPEIKEDNQKLKLSWTGYSTPANDMLTLKELMKHFGLSKGQFTKIDTGAKKLVFDALLIKLARVRNLILSECES